MLFLFILCIMQIERRLAILRKKVCEAFRKKKVNYKLQLGLCESQILSSESIRRDNSAVVI